MSSNSKVTIIRLAQLCETQPSISPHIGRVVGLVSASNFMKLMRVMDVKSNPRSPKESSVTKDIVATLQSTPERFHFMSKGILLSVSHCRILERNRIEIDLVDNPYATPGILDGGHNTFAISKFLLSFALTESELKSIKDWQTLHKFWQANAATLEDLFSDQQSTVDSSQAGFLIPIEIIYPRNPEDSQEMERWGESHRDITHARNNNIQLTDATQDNHQGLYDFLKGTLPAEIAENIEWKANAGGAIKAADVVALALIPLSCLPKSVIGTEINLTKIYNSKQHCVETFRSILIYNSNGTFNGQIYTLHNESIKSALRLMHEVLRGYDFIYKNFPSWYNKADGSFGKINGVRIYKSGDQSGLDRKKYSQKPFSTKFFDEESAYHYADGFILPLVVGLRRLMKYSADVEQLTWSKEPLSFLEASNTKIVAMYTTVIRLANYDPQKIGKDRGSYEIAEAAMTVASTT